MYCEITLWIWLGLTPTCQGWTEHAFTCQYKAQPTRCPFTVILEPERRTMTITGPNDVAKFDFPIQEAGWKKFSWREQGALAQLEGMGWRRQT